MCETLLRFAVDKEICGRFLEMVTPPCHVHVNNLRRHDKIPFEECLFRRRVLHNKTQTPHFCNCKHFDSKSEERLPVMRSFKYEVSCLLCCLFPVIYICPVHRHLRQCAEINAWEKRNYKVILCYVVKQGWFPVICILYSHSPFIVRISGSPSVIRIVFS